MANLLRTHPIAIKAIKMLRLYNENSTISGVPYVFLYYYVPVKYQHDKEYSFTQEVKTSCHKISTCAVGCHNQAAQPMSA